MKKAIPISVETLNDRSVPTYIDYLTKMGAEEVFLCCLRLDDMGKACDIIQKYSAIFEKAGFSTAIWFWTLSCVHDSRYTCIQSFDGTSSAWACPLCDEFVEDFLDITVTLAKTGIKKIVLDDDFRLQITDSVTGCFCDEHMKLYSKMLGEPVTVDQMKNGIKEGPMNKYREVWLKANKEVLDNHAKKIRKAVDTVDSNIDIMLCYGPALFGADGSDAVSLSKNLSHREKPVARLSGAPFWANSGFVKNMMSAVDFERMQAVHCKKQGIITYAEADSYPRPRHQVSAAFLEIFHTVAIADGNFDGILKYVFDYVSSPEYELGYTKKDIENGQLYRDIERIFSGKRAVGINIVEPFDRRYHIPGLKKNAEIAVMNSDSRDFLNNNSFPAVFEENTVNLAFGENAYCVNREMLKNGIILDIEAAKILAEKGIDVGVKSFGDCDYEIPVNPDCNPGFYEYFIDEDEKVGIYGALGSRELVLDDKAELSSTIYNRGKDFIGSFRYENADGIKFFVYNFDAERANRVRGIIKGYCREHQLAKVYEWISGKPFPALCQGNPNLYTMCKTGESSMAVGLWNCFPDSIDKPIIKLDKAYSKIEFVNCDGTLSGDTVTLSKLGAFEYAFFEVK